MTRDGKVERPKPSSVICYSAETSPIKASVHSSRHKNQKRTYLSQSKNKNISHILINNGSNAAATSQVNFMLPCFFSIAKHDIILRGKFCARFPWCSIKLVSERHRTIFPFKLASSELFFFCSISRFFAKNSQLFCSHRSRVLKWRLKEEFKLAIFVRHANTNVCLD